jgi:hypothetical protein
MHTGRMQARLVTGLLAAGLVLALWSSRAWTLAVDAPLLAYTAYAIDTWHLAPYRDLFDFNTPGAYLANIAIGRVFGYTEGGFRTADITILLALLGTTVAALRSFGWRAASASALCFGYLYWGYGPSMSLQREFLLLLPIAAALVVAFESRWPPWLRAVVVGALGGAAATIKPHAALILPAFVGWLHWQTDRGSRALVWLGAAAGCSVPIAAAFAWVQAHGASDAFLDIVQGYWPLYNELTGARPHHVLSGSDLWWYRVDRFIFSRDLRQLILWPAAGGVWLALTYSTLDAPRRARVILLLAVAVALEIYPLAAGKYWGYHWLPSIYGASLLTGLCFVPLDPLRRPRHVVAAAVVLIVSAQLAGVAREWRAYLLRDGTPTVAEEIAGELAPRLAPGDTVQPLDWTGGAVHALLLTRTRIATPFLYDFYFYHHPDSGYVTALRRRFLDQLAAARPAFVVMTDQLRRLEGPRTTYRFDALTGLLARDYCVVVATRRFVLYERRDRARHCL